MRLVVVIITLLLFPLSAFAQNDSDTKDHPQTIYINNEIPAEILRAYNEQAALISEMRLKIQNLEHQLFQANERITNLENEVWDR